MIDRFGNMPKEIENLLEIARIKNLCKKSYVIKLASKRNKIVFTFDPDRFNIEAITSILVEKQYRNRTKFLTDVKPTLTLNIETNSEKLILKEVKDFLNKIISINNAI